MGDATTPVIDERTHPADVRKIVTAQLRADLPFLLSAHAQDSGEILNNLAKLWQKYHPGILTMALHLYAAETGKEDFFYGPTTVKWSGTQLQTRRGLLPLHDLPIGRFLCSWAEFFRHFLDGEDRVWFNQLISAHDMHLIL